jgi:hypothetical protein
LEGLFDEQKSVAAYIDKIEKGKNHAKINDPGSMKHFKELWTTQRQLSIILI